MILTVAAALSALSTPVHSTEIAHAAYAYTASYHAQSTVRTRQVETRFVNRPSTQICRWQADLVVNRAVAAQGRPVAAIGKSIHRFEPLSGSYAGSCEAARHHIDAEVARYSRARAGEALAVAQQDRAVLVNELDSLQALSVKGG